MFCVGTLNLQIIDMSCYFVLVANQNCYDAASKSNETKWCDNSKHDEMSTEQK